MARRDCTWLGREDHVELDLPQIREVCLCVREKKTADCIWQRRKEQAKVVFQIHKKSVYLLGGENIYDSSPE